MAPRLFDNTRRLLDLIAEEGPLPATRLATALEIPRSTVIPEGTTIVVGEN